MALTFAKKNAPRDDKPAGKAASKSSVPKALVAKSPFADRIDEVGQAMDAVAAEYAKLEDVLAPIKAKADAVEKQRAALIKDILKEYADNPEIDPDDTGLEAGATHQVEVGVAQHTRTITDMEAVRKVMGDKNFMKAASVTLKALDDYLNAKEKAQVITEGRGRRTAELKPRVD